ncbi:hypothetical protein AAFC00_002904 [Neodothiora populina]|uniref:Mannosyltransferase n=1 Tax=Neodothiora populina TaxID=2781224 RepID=A0ABR3P8M0_9PEZI
MWGGVYLCLVLLRLYIALSPSYLHPDEHLQGPEVITGRVFSFPTHLTWEFTSATPIRSVFPLWVFYGWPLTLLKWLAEGSGYQTIPSASVFYTLRVLMFLLSFVLEDWALHELLPSSKQRRSATLLVASSYVTWTYQTHTFSNAIETLLVLWCLVLIGRIVEDKQTSQFLASAILAFLVVLGVFNRITFPAFIVVPLMRLLPHFFSKPITLLVMTTTGVLTTLLAICVDTEWYTNGRIHFRHLSSKAVITPWNNFVYNLDPDNLAKHGLHPYYQHFLVNLPQLLGPAILLLVLRPRLGMRFYSAMCGIATLSCFKHQEARFLLPAIPLLLSTVRLPQRSTKLWIGVWLIFNVCLGILMGVYHQGGVVPAQLWIAEQPGIAQVYWWKTYSPPMYLLGQHGGDVVAKDLMGMRGELMVEELEKAVACEANSTTLLVAPLSATFLDPYTTGLSSEPERTGIHLEKVWQWKQHLNLDDMDFGDDGVLPTISRVVGRRGIGAWNVRNIC